MNTSVAVPPVDIPFRYLREGVPLLMVAVKVNGQGPFDFVLDSGNGMECIALSPELAATLGIALHMETLEYAFPIGFSKTFSKGRIDSLEIGALRESEMDIAVLPALSELGE